MTFIISNKPLPLFEKIGDIYLNGNYLKKKSHLLIFKGVSFSENKVRLLDHIIKNGMEYLTKLKGYFCGIYYDLINNLIYIFTDKFGHFDLFYYFHKNILIISDNFNEILKNKKFSINDVNKDSLMEFIFFEYPLFEKTFLKSIKYVPLGSIYKFDLNRKILVKKQYYDYAFNIDPKFNIKKGVKRLEVLINNAFRRIKKINPPNTVYGLGLSGGMDSRLISYYALKNNLKLKTFIFGEKNSDAYYIARKTAHLLGLDHYELGFEDDFYKYSEISIEFNPMMNVLYTWYFSIYKKLPQFDVLLTGYNGDNQFGSHLSKLDLKITNDNDFVNRILEKYCVLGNFKKTLDFFNDKSRFLKIRKELIQFSKDSPNLKYWQKKEKFNYKYRQRIFIKNNPSFNFFGLHDSSSIFVDPDLFDYFMKIPFNLRLNQRLFYKFLRKKAPILLKIRPEREIPIYLNKFLLKYIFKMIRFIDLKYQTYFIFKKSHKTVEKWVSNNRNFINFLIKVFTKHNNYFKNFINHTKIMSLISKEKWDSYETNIIFRFLTIKLFLDRL